MSKEKNNIPNILIADHPPLSKEGIGKTLYAFFAEWPKKNLNQVFTVKLQTDLSLCSYYYIDQFGLRRDKILDEDISVAPNLSGRAYHFVTSIAHRKLGVVLRNLLFKLGERKHDNLKKWIKSKNISCIFYGIGEIVSENDFYYNIAKELDIPLILYISDDYYTKWENGGAFFNYRRTLLNNYIKLFSYSTLIVVISDAMKDLYRAVFPNNDYYIAQNATFPKKTPPKKFFYVHGKRLIKVSYTGNIGLGRLEVLNRIRQSVDKINQNSAEYQIEIDIYTYILPTKTELKAINSGCMRYCGSVISTELDSVRFDSDILLLVESFDVQYKHILATALSTKVPEYLSYERNILAIAPIYAESLKYLNMNNAATCISRENDLDISLRCYFNDYILGKKSIEIVQAKKLFDKKHNLSNNAKAFSSEIIRCIREWSQKNMRNLNG